MSVRQFLVNLLWPPRKQRPVQPAGPKTSEDYAQAIEVEKERRRGMRGGGF